jgi:hypothetical protein
MSATPDKPQNPLLDLVLNVVLPSLILEKLSKPAYLGPQWALVVAVSIPLAYGLWSFSQKRGMNFFSVFGLVAIIFTGGLGLLKLDPVWFSAKEAAFPLFLGLAFPLSLRFGRPLVNEMLLNPQVVNVPLIQKSLDTPQRVSGFASLLKKASWGMAGTMLCSSIANFFLCWYVLNGKTPGTEEYTQAIGKQNWMGFIVIGIPMFVVTLMLFFWFLKRITALTGLERDDLMNNGQTVRRQVSNGE